ncbi:MAG: hypothetical protein M0C28_01090 [Candidatus Moduliflexus flocculans]|nr:hypothetical protein [Candidatus Moduliflexus flocculans]
MPRAGATSTVANPALWKLSTAAFLGLSWSRTREAGSRGKRSSAASACAGAGGLRFGRLPAFGARRLFEEQVREGRDQAGIGDKAFGFDDLRVPGDLDPVGGSQGLDEPVADDDRAFFNRRPGNRDDPAVADGVGRADIAGRKRGGEHQDGRDGEGDGSGDSRDGLHGTSSLVVPERLIYTTPNRRSTRGRSLVGARRLCYSRVAGRVRLTRPPGTPAPDRPERSRP